MVDGAGKVMCRGLQSLLRNWRWTFEKEKVGGVPKSLHHLSLNGKGPIVK